MSDNNDVSTNLIINYLPPNMSENDLHTLFSTIGEIVSVKLAKTTINGIEQSLGYGFVKYRDQEAARQAIDKFNGKHLLGKILKVAFARPSENKKDENSTNLYVAGLPRNYTQNDLLNLFQSFGEVQSTKIFTQASDGTERERPIAFVLFARHEDAKTALDGLNGTVPGGFDEPITIKFSSAPGQGKQPDMKHPQNSRMPLVPNVGPNAGGGWVIFVYNLAPEIQEIDLWRLFGPFGAILSIKIVTDEATHQSKGYAFVSMTKYEEAVMAIRALDGHRLAERVLQVNFKTNKPKNEMMENNGNNQRKRKMEN